MIRDTPAGVEFDARITPRARKTEFVEIRDDVVVARLAAPPVEGAANDALIEFLSARLGIARRAIRIVSGERSRHKRVAISGMTAARLRGTLHPPA